MNIYQFNNVVYKGNINRKFYFYCLSKNIKLVKFLILNVWYYIVSKLFISKKDIYEEKKFCYLESVSNLDDILNKFIKRSRINKEIEISSGVIIDRVPNLFLKKFISNKNIKLQGYELNKNYEVNVEKFNNNISNYDDVKNLFVRKTEELIQLRYDNKYIVNNRKPKLYVEKKVNNSKILKILSIIFLSIVLTFVSFYYTDYNVNFLTILSFYDFAIIVLNFLPILFIFIILVLLSRRIDISWLIISILILFLGVANQTKLLYRNDIVKFEDIFLIKEASIMATQYEIVIKWYSIVFLIAIILIFFIMHFSVEKIYIKLKNRVLLLVLVLFLGIICYNNIYKNVDVFNSIGTVSEQYKWIYTEKYKAKGMIYSFIYTLEEGFIEKPENYSQKKAESILNKYVDKDIPEDKKVNIIAIMLEAYNDFSAISSVDLNESVYEKLHEIQKKSISGKLVTSIYGANTIVTERNFLTGYYTFPSFNGITNSYVWYLKNQGYKTEAMHPGYGAFYDRIDVNYNLGFDNYYYLENKFSFVEKDYLEHTGFLRDYDFFDYIIEGYEQSKKENKPYFNFSVTYQNHGPYYSEKYENKAYYYNYDGDDYSTYNEVNDYLSGIKMTNEALEKLIDYFDNEEEPVIVIFFGDHNPYLGYDFKGYEQLGIDMSLKSLESLRNYYETLYVIHANESAKNLFGKTFVGEGSDTSPIFLMNELFDYCGLEGNQYLQYMSDLKKYVDAINPYYYKEDGNFILKDESKYSQKILEYNWINYYEMKKR